MEAILRVFSFEFFGVIVFCKTGVCTVHCALLFGLPIRFSFRSGDMQTTVLHAVSTQNESETR